MDTQINGQLLTRKDLSLKLNCSIRLIDKYTKFGMPCVKIGDLKRYDYEEVIDWLRDRQEMAQ